MNNPTLPRTRSRVNELLDLLYPLPACLDWDAERPSVPDARYFGADIREMSPLERRCEAERIRQRLLVDDSPHWWLLQRLDRLEAYKARDNAK